MCVTWRADAHDQRGARRGQVQASVAEEQRAATRRHARAALLLPAAHCLHAALAVVCLHSARGMYVHART